MAATDIFFVVGLARHAKTHVQPLLYTTAAPTLFFLFFYTPLHIVTYALPFHIRVLRCVLIECIFRAAYHFINPRPYCT